MEALTRVALSPALLAIASAACVASALVLTQRGLRHRGPWAGAMVSVPTTTVLYWLLAPFMLAPVEWRSDAAAIFAAVGLFFPAAVTVLTFEANRLLGPNIAGALGNLAPLVAVAVAIVVLGEAPTGVRLLGVAVVVAGVTVLVWRVPPRDDRRPAVAFGLPLLAAAIRGAIQPAVKAGLALWPSPFAAGLIGYTVSSVVILAVGWCLARHEPRTAAGRWWFMAVGLCNGAAVLLMYAAPARGSVSLVSPLVATYPLFTLGLARILLADQRIGVSVAVGVAITVGGVALLLAG